MRCKQCEYDVMNEYDQWCDVHQLCYGCDETCFDRKRRRVPHPLDRHPDVSESVGISTDAVLPLVSQDTRFQFRIVSDESVPEGEMVIKPERRHLESEESWRARCVRVKNIGSVENFSTLEGPSGCESTAPNLPVLSSDSSTAPRNHPRNPDPVMYLSHAQNPEIFGNYILDSRKGVIYNLAHEQIHN